MMKFNFFYFLFIVFFLAISCSKNEINTKNQIKEKYKNQPINTVDGVKIEFDMEWVHLRKSNTEPIIRIYAEGNTQRVADSLVNKIKSDIKELTS